MPVVESQDDIVLLSPKPQRDEKLRRIALISARHASLPRNAIFLGIPRTRRTLSRTMPIP